MKVNFMYIDFLNIFMIIIYKAYLTDSKYKNILKICLLKTFETIQLHLFLYGMKKKYITVIKQFYFNFTFIFILIY